jgi:hypothetical protein
MTPSNDARKDPDGTVYDALTERWSSAVGAAPSVMSVDDDGVPLPLPLVVPYAALPADPCSGAAMGADVFVAFEHEVISAAAAKAADPAIAWRASIR